MSYNSLKNLSYSSKDFENQYQKRIADDNTFQLNFEIASYKAFYNMHNDVSSLMFKILESNTEVVRLRSKLPSKALEQFAEKCLTDEVVITNRIEGIHSTRREIGEVLRHLDTKHKKERFSGLVTRYKKLLSGEKFSINTHQDIRDLYDELVLDEVTKQNKNDMPDGEFYRKGSVSVLSGVQKEIHQGVYPEQKIVEKMQQAILIFNDDNIHAIIRIAIFHYLIGYIHPFYDGNGRLSRFISSSALSKNLDPLLGCRMSYTIHENISAYYEGFKICNDPKNRGDLTPFILMFLQIVLQSVQNLEKALSDRTSQLDNYSKIIQTIEFSNDKYRDIIFILVQAKLFSRDGVATADLCPYVSVNKATLTKRLNLLIREGLADVKKIGRKNYYSAKLEYFEKYVDQMNKNT